VVARELFFYEHDDDTSKYEGNVLNLNNYNKDGSPEAAANGFETTID
jgi:hypothetical protein